MTCSSSWDPDQGFSTQPILSPNTYFSTTSFCFPKQGMCPEGLLDIINRNHLQLSCRRKMYETILGKIASWLCQRYVCHDIYNYITNDSGKWKKKDMNIITHKMEGSKTWKSLYSEKEKRCCTAHKTDGKAEETGKTKSLAQPLQKPEVAAAPEGTATALHMAGSCSAWMELRPHSYTLAPWELGQHSWACCRRSGLYHPPRLMWWGIPPTREGDQPPNLQIAATCGDEVTEVSLLSRLPAI